MISKKQLFEWEKVARQATHGPWYLCESYICTKKPKDTPSECKFNCEDKMIYSDQDLLFQATFNPSVALMLINCIYELEEKLKGKKK